MAANEYRHRAIVWGVQSHFYMDFLVWLLNCWGIVPLTDMLSMDNTKMIAEEDTPENREQAIYDIAMLTEKMIMRNRTYTAATKVLLDDLWEFVNGVQRRHGHSVGAHELQGARRYARIV